MMTQPTEHHFTIKDMIMAAGGSLPFLVPLELLGMGQAALITGIAGGLVGYVWGDDLLRIAQKRIPTLQDTQSLKKWLLSRPSDENVDMHERTILDRAPGRNYARPKEQVDDLPTEEAIDAEIARMQQEENEAFRLPVAPNFPDMCHLIQPGKMVLCYSIDGPIYGTVQDLLSMIIIGKPGRGKTTALIYYVAILLKYGAEVHVWDPHGSMSDLSDISDQLYYVDDYADFPQSMAYLFAELEERRALYKKDKSTKHPLLFLADELPEIAAYAGSNPDVGKLFELFVLSARKWNCFFIGSGQGTNASILPTMISQNLSSRAIFYTEVERARMAGLSTGIAKELLPHLRPDTAIGRMIFDCSRLDPFIGAIPWITTDDVKRWLGTSVYKNQPPVNREMSIYEDVNIPVNSSRGGFQPLPQKGHLPFSVNKNAEREEASMPPVNENTAQVDTVTRDHIRRMVEAGFKHADIAKIVRLDGRKYSIYRQICTEEGIKIGEGA